METFFRWFQHLQATMHVPSATEHVLQEHARAGIKIVKICTAGPTCQSPTSLTTIHSPPSPFPLGQRDQASPHNLPMPATSKHSPLVATGHSSLPNPSFNPPRGFPSLIHSPQIHRPSMLNSYPTRSTRDFHTIKHGVPWPFICQ